MTLFSKVLIIAAYGISIVYLPWWVSVILGIILLAAWQAYVSVIFGAVVLDIAFGAPIHALSDFSYLYTALFAILAAVTLMLSRTMLE